MGQRTGPISELQQTTLVNNPDSKIFLISTVSKQRSVLIQPATVYVFIHEARERKGKRERERESEVGQRIVCDTVR